MSFDTRHQSGFFAANESAATETDLQIEVVTGLQNVFTEKPVFLRLVDGYLKSLDGYGIFGTDINVTLMTADGVTGYGHGFDDGMGIAFQYRPVHKRTGIAFVGVTADVFDVAGGVFGELPFHAGGETAAASSSQSTRLYNVDDVLRSIFGKHFRKCLITVVSYVFVDIFGVDKSAVTESDAGLFLVELRIVEGLDRFLLHLFGIFIKKMGDYSALNNVFFDDFVDVFGFNVRVKSPFGINDYDRSAGAKSETTGHNAFNFVFQTFGFELFFHQTGDFVAVAAGTTRSAADKYVVSKHLVSS